MIQAPIFHVNGDDPEACVRVARLAFAYRQAFHRDVVVDIVCYRRHGHNEGDDPSYTQPQMYKKIEQHRSVRKIYTETLVARGDITVDEAEQALDEFNAPPAGGARRDALVGAADDSITLPERRAPRAGRASRCPTGVERGRCSTPSSDRLGTVPEGFTVHPKLERQFGQRAEL